MEDRQITQSCCCAEFGLLLGRQRTWHEHDRVVKEIEAFIIRCESVGNPR